MFSVHSSGSAGNIGTNEESNTYQRGLLPTWISEKPNTDMQYTLHPMMYLGGNKKPFPFVFSLKMNERKAAKMHS